MVLVARIVPVLAAFVTPFPLPTRHHTPIVPPFPLVPRYFSSSRPFSADTQQGPSKMQQSDTCIVACLGLHLSPSLPARRHPQRRLPQRRGGANWRARGGMPHLPHPLLDRIPERLPHGLSTRQAVDTGLPARQRPGVGAAAARVATVGKLVTTPGGKPALRSIPRASSCFRGLGAPCCDVYCMLLILSELVRHRRGWNASTRARSMRGKGKERQYHAFTGFAVLRTP